MPREPTHCRPLSTNILLEHHWHGWLRLGSLPAGITANIITNGSAIVLNVSQIPVLGPVTITNQLQWKHTDADLAGRPGLEAWRCQTNSLPKD